MRNARRDGRCEKAVVNRLRQASATEEDSIQLGVFAV
jgi:hypothetical protein